VADDIVLLQQGARAAGQAMTLKDAYDKACRLNPVVNAKLVEAATAAAIDKAKKDEEARVAEAKKATQGNVKTGGHQGSGTAATGSMDDTMAETLKAIQARGK
jgi:Tfp pilus assembly protein PilW